MERLREQLDWLRTHRGLVGIKAGTEVEAQTFDEIWLMRTLSSGILPLTVKIGGPEARNDIEQMLAANVDCILAPMIESPYSLKNFVATMKALDREKRAKLAVNIETITAWKSLQEIFDSPAFASISQVTVGRSDLAGSMELDVDDPRVSLITREIITAARVRSKATSVGGRINTENARLVQENLGAHYVNTRHMVVNLSSGDAAANIAAALLWERDYYNFCKKYFPERSAFYRSRIGSIEERIAAGEVDCQLGAGLALTGT